MVVAGTQDAIMMVESKDKGFQRKSCSAPSCSATRRCVA